MPEIVYYARGERLRILRERRGLTQTELVQKLAECGIRYSQARISRLERGWGEPPQQVMAGLAQALETSILYLQLLTDDPTPQASDEFNISTEAEEAARLVDGLPANSRAAVLSALKAMVGKGDLVIEN